MKNKENLPGEPKIKKYIREPDELTIINNTLFKELKEACDKDYSGNDMWNILFENRDGKLKKKLLRKSPEEEEKLYLPNGDPGDQGKYSDLLRKGEKE